MVSSKYVLALCHLFHPVLHGFNENSDTSILGHYLVYWSFNIDDFKNNTYKNDLIDLKHFYNIVDLDNNHRFHPTIKNYSNIIKKENYIKLEIIQLDVLNGFEEVGYIKTFWLRIFQKKWKSIFKKRKEKIKFLSNPRNLLKREINGK